MTARTSHWRTSLVRGTALSATLLALCSCSIPGKQAGIWPRRDQSVQHAYVDEKPSQSHHVELLTHEVSSHEGVVVRPQSPDGGYTLPNSAAQRPLPVSGPIQHESVARVPFRASSAAAVQPASAGSPLTIGIPENCPTGTCPPVVTMPCEPFALPEYFADEYVCDGGDLNLPVHYEGNFRAGLDTEDTVAEYRDEFGKAYVKPSTRVCIYAPRFAAVRSSSLPHQGVQVHRATGYHDGLPVAGVDTRLIIETRVQNEELLGFNTRSRAGDVDGQQWLGNVASVLSPDRHVKLLNAFEDLKFQPGQQYDGTLIPIIGQAAQFANEWSLDRAAVIIAHDQADRVIIGRSSAQAYTAIEVQEGKGDLTIVKVADRGAAVPGDVVTFTIRFDNVGGRPLHNVRVVDNLSPRLEYVPGSVECTLAGSVRTEPTDGGTMLLTFEFDQPLAPRTGGALTFQCRVR